MARKPDVKANGLGNWDAYSGKPAAEAAEQIYDHVQSASTLIRDWYWRSIGSKRTASLFVRGLAFALLVAGAALPILAGIDSAAETRLLLTQVGVAALAVAGLTQAADKVFGWSSGWLRYITTATAMENAARRFNYDWASHLLAASGPLTMDDARALFELARAFEAETAKLQSDETNKWVSEFNSGMALLTELIKTEREASEKKVQAAQAAALEKSTASKPGAVEVEIRHQAAPQPVEVQFEDESPEPFTGGMWSRKGLSPGLYRIVIRYGQSFGLEESRMAEVKAGAITHITVALS